MLQLAPIYDMVLHLSGERGVGLATGLGLGRVGVCGAAPADGDRALCVCGKVKSMPPARCSRGSRVRAMRLGRFSRESKSAAVATECTQTGDAHSQHGPLRTDASISLEQLRSQAYRPRTQAVCRHALAFASPGDASREHAAACPWVQRPRASDQPLTHTCYAYGTPPTWPPATGRRAARS